MTSQKQIEANRLNAQKSTGPRTPEGKDRSSRNALKTGIDARHHTVPGERLHELEALTREYYDRFVPTTPEQRTLVDTLIDCEWLLRRFRLVEAQLWEQNPIFETTLAKAYRSDFDLFSRLQRRIDMTQRNYRNALHDLERLQAAEADDDEDPEHDPDAAPAATAPQQTANPAIGFVPQLSAHRPYAPPPAPRINAKRMLDIDNFMM